MKGARTETTLPQKYWWKGTELLSVSQFLTAQRLFFLFLLTSFTSQPTPSMFDFNTVFFYAETFNSSYFPFSSILLIFWIKVQGWYEELPNSFYCPVLSFEKNGTKCENYIRWIHNHEELFPKQKQIEI